MPCYDVPNFKTHCVNRVISYVRVSSLVSFDFDEVIEFVEVLFASIFFLLEIHDP